MHLRILFAVFVLALAAVAVAAKPLVLIAQVQVQEFTDVDPNVDVMRPLSAVLEGSGRVTTVIWSDVDPLVAAAIREAGFKYVSSPKPEQVFQLARVIKADYVLICTAARAGGIVRAKAEFFRASGGRPLFSDETSTSITKNDVLDVESSTLSIANTWVVKLFAGPLKTLPGDPGIESPPPGDPAITVAPKIAVDNAPLENGLKALAEGKTLEAIALLRDAVDVDPTNATARLALIEALKRAGKPFLAADEAIRGAQLNPSNLDLLVAAADCYLEGGRPDEAMELVTTALEANPRNEAALILLGDLNVSALNYAEAISAYTKAIEIRADAETYYKRAQAYAIAEDFSKSAEDLARASELGLSKDADKASRRYRGVVKVIDNSFVTLAAAVRNMILEAKSAGSIDDMARRVAETLTKCAAFNDYLAKLTAPPQHEKSHEQRLLALSLLAQSAQGLQRYLKDRQGETLEDANLLQIEAMRELASAQQLFGKEISQAR